MSDSDSKENEEEIIAEDTEEILSVDYDTDKQLDPNGPVNTDHQDKDLDLLTVKKFIIVSFAVTLGFFVLMLIVLRFYKTDFESERGVATLEERQIPGKDDALLQTQPLVDLAEYNELEATRMTMTTNAVEHAVIPVEAAKQLMLTENAFPTPAAPQVEEQTTEGIASSSTQPEPSAMTKPATTEVKKPLMTAEAMPASMEMITEPAPDPVLVAAGEKIFTAQCMVCHSGKKGAIGPNIQKAYGSMRQLENHDPILMDHDYIINSLNNPMDHIAKGYMPVMMSFKQQLTPAQEEEVVAYLKSQGTLISKPAPVTKAPVVEAAPEPVVEAPARTEKVVEPAPAKAPAPVMEQPVVPEVEEQPEAPVEPEPEKEPKGIIFV